MSSDVDVAVRVGVRRAGRARAYRSNVNLVAGAVGPAPARPTIGVIIVTIEPVRLTVSVAFCLPSTTVTDCVVVSITCCAYAG